MVGSTSSEVFLVSADVASDAHKDDDGVDVIIDYGDQRRLVGVGHKLVLGNITRDSDDVFECHADNGVPPPTRKTFHVTVECKHLVKHQRNTHVTYLFTSPTFGEGNVFTTVCLSVSPRDISKTDAAEIIKVEVEMFHDKSWKSIYFGVKISEIKVMSHKNIANVGRCT